MSTICADHHYTSPNSSNKKHLFKDGLDIPPRKLLLNLAKSTPKYHHHDFGLDDMAHFYKHLPCNELGKADLDLDDEDGDPYSSDHFRMYEFKVRRCTRSRSHDWTDCPFAHPGEKARRRDPRKFHYTGSVCPEFRRGGGCARGDNCEFAHGVFECWMHPSRYRTEACKDGKSCKRKVCFFAHTPRQLRLLPEKSSPAARKINHHQHQDIHHCGGCLACRGGGGSSSVASSPTSTLLGMSHLSPPLSPSMSSSPPVSPVSGHHRLAGSGGGGGGFSHRLSKFQTRFMSYKDVLTELMSSLEAMNFSEEAAAAAVAAAAAASVSSSPPSAGTMGYDSGGGRKMNLSVNPWINEVCFNNHNNIGDDNYHQQVQMDQQQQQQFVMSPSTPNYAANSSGFDKYLIGSGGEYFPAGRDSEFVAGAERVGADDQNGAGSGGCDPDLGWVNELLM